MGTPGTVLITGTTSGVGLNATRALVQQGWTVITANRNPQRAAGAADELGIPSDLPSARAVGVAELLRVIRGEMTLEAAVTKAKTSSRNLAKRQITWFKRQIRADMTSDEKYMERDNDKIFAFIRQFVLTEGN